MSSPPTPDVPPAALVLVGGASSRMGTPKASLDWHGRPLLAHVCDLVAQVAPLVVVVRQQGQPLPALSAGIEVVEDPRPGVGPLMGVAAGLAHVEARARRAVVTATDQPFLTAPLLHALLRFSQPASGTPPEVVAPVVGGHRQVMCSVWQTSLHARLFDEVEAGFRGPNQVLQKYRTLEVTPELLLAQPGVAAADPHLDGLRGFNTPEDYRAALAGRRP